MEDTNDKIAERMKIESRHQLIASGIKGACIVAIFAILFIPWRKGV